MRHGPCALCHLRLMPVLYASLPSLPRCALLNFSEKRSEVNLYRVAPADGTGACPACPVVGTIVLGLNTCPVKIMIMRGKVYFTGVSKKWNVVNLTGAPWALNLFSSALRIPNSEVNKPPSILASGFLSSQLLINYSRRDTEFFSYLKRDTFSFNLNNPIGWFDIHNKLGYFCNIPLAFQRHGLVKYGKYIRNSKAYGSRSNQKPFASV